MKGAQKPLTCRWCTALASGTVSAHGGKLSPIKVPHCEEHWDDAYEAVRSYPERTWKFIEQPQGLF